MTRHGKNCTAGSVYTYHEKMRDMRAGGYGTQAERLGKDAQKEFDCCCLTLQPCRDPVITPDGYLYDREAILEYIVKHKMRIMKEQKSYEKSKEKQDAEKKESTDKKPKKKDEKKEDDRKDVLPSFWVPSLTPQAAPSTFVPSKAPDSEVRCPMSGNPLRSKKLLPVKWTLVPDDDGEKKSLIAKKARYMCAVSHDVLGNSVPCVYLKTSGHIVTEECFEKVIKKDWLDPTNGAKIREKDVIPLQRGGTGFSSTNDKLTAAVARPVMTS